MTSSRTDPLTLEEYIAHQRILEFEKANRLASAWSSGPPMPPGSPVFAYDPGTNVVRSVNISNGSITRSEDTVAIDRNQYDVHQTYDDVLESLNAVIENVANDLTNPGVAGITPVGLKAVRRTFDSLIDVRNDFMGNESAFATRKPDPVPDITPDADGIVHDRYGNVVGRVVTSQE